MHEQAAPLLGAILGKTAHLTATMAAGELLAQLEATPDSLGIVPFDQLDPRFKVLTVDGVNVLSNRFDPSVYPLAVALTVEGRGASVVRPLLQGLVQPATNRDPSRLTQLIMTGVTAMSRVTAVKMDRNGYDYPALRHLGCLCGGRHHPHLQRSAVSGRLCGESGRE